MLKSLIHNFQLQFDSWSLAYVIGFPQDILDLLGLSKEFPNGWKIHNIFHVNLLRAFVHDWDTIPTNFSLDYQKL